MSTSSPPKLGGLSFVPNVAQFNTLPIASNATELQPANTWDLVQAADFLCDRESLDRLVAKASEWLFNANTAENKSAAFSTIENCCLVRIIASKQQSAYIMFSYSSDKGMHYFLRPGSIPLPPIPPFQWSLARLSSCITSCRPVGVLKFV